VGNAGDDVRGVWDGILEEVRIGLMAAASSLADANGLDPGLELQSRSIFDEIDATLRRRAGPENPDRRGSGTEALAAHGRQSGLRDRDPSEPLQAAELLFDLSLVPLTDFYAECSPTQVARVLHHAIWRRFPPGAIAYVNVLRDRLRAAEEETHRRLARDLHDHVAQGLAASLQRLDLARRDPTQLERAEDILRTTLEQVGMLAMSLHSFADDRSLARVLERHIADYGPDPAVRLHCVGSERLLPVAAVEEVYGIVTESVRNAVTHAERATAVDVELEWETERLVVTIRDDGIVTTGTPSRASLGLEHIRQRGAAVGGVVSISASPRFEVELVVPYGAA
jgi:signal transduction histidine kinase